MKKMVLFSGGVDSLLALLKDLKKDEISEYLFLFVDNNIDEESVENTKSLYNLLTKIFPTRITRFIIQKVTYSEIMHNRVKEYTPKIMTWLNLYSTAIQVSLSENASSIICGVNRGDGQDELKFHSYFSELSRQLYGIKILTPLLYKRWKKNEILDEAFRTLDEIKKQKPTKEKYIEEIRKKLKGRYNYVNILYSSNNK